MITKPLTRRYGTISQSYNVCVFLAPTTHCAGPCQRRVSSQRHLTRQFSSLFSLSLSLPLPLSLSLCLAPLSSSRAQRGPSAHGGTWLHSRCGDNTYIPMGRSSARQNYVSLFFAVVCTPMSGHPGGSCFSAIALPPASPLPSMRRPRRRSTR